MAGSEGLDPSQRARVAELMTTKISTWPPGLIAHVRAAGGSFCVDALADAVAGWVRENPA